MHKRPFLQTIVIKILSDVNLKEIEKGIKIFFN